jgi:hypothetical protein
MASTYTTGFGIEKIGTGEQAGAWGTTTNHNADILDRIASYTAVALSGTTHTLTVRGKLALVPEPRTFRTACTA